MTATYSALRSSLIRQADDAHTRYAQYAGYWDGSEWQVVQARRDVSTKMGLAIAKGDYVLAKADRPTDKWDCCGGCIRGGKCLGPFFTVYSFRNGCNTSIRGKDLNLEPAI